MKNKLIRITTIPISLDKLLDGQLAFMKEHYHVIAVSSDKHVLNQIGAKNGISVFPVEMTRKITPIKDLKALWELYKFFKREQPFIVHTHTPKAGTIGMMASKLAGVPHRLHTVAGLPLLEVSGKKRKLLNLVEKITYACSTNIYPNSKGLQDIILKEKFCSENKLKVIGKGSSNGINTDHFDPSIFNEDEKKKLKSELNINENDFVFIFVGRLVSDKGINELVHAFDNISATTGNVKLLLVGDFERSLDPLNENTEMKIGNNNHIISVGFQNDVRPYFAISDLLVFPSYREGFPNVVMQAGAMGLPAIVTDINGCNEIIVDRENGLIVPKKNATVLEKTMSLFIKDKQMHKKMKTKVREMISSRYQQKVVWDALLTEYKQLESI